MKPTVGRIVHYRVSAHLQAASAGEVRAAIVTRVWSDTCVNLSVFWDASDSATLPQHVTSVVQGSGEGHWDWPIQQAVGGR